MASSISMGKVKRRNRSYSVNDPRMIEEHEILNASDEKDSHQCLYMGLHVVVEYIKTVENYTRNC